MFSFPDYGPSCLGNNTNKPEMSCNKLTSTHMPEWFMTLLWTGSLLQSFSKIHIQSVTWPSTHTAFQHGCHERMHVARSHDWLSSLHCYHKEPSDHTLARWAEILSMENAEYYQPSELMTLSVLCTLNNVGSSAYFLKSMCLYTVIATHAAFTRSLSHAQNVPGN